MRKSNARHSFTHAWHASDRCWFDGRQACRLVSDAKWEETTVGVLGVSPIGAAIASLSGVPLPFKDGMPISGELKTPMGALAFVGQVFTDTALRAYIALDPLDVRTWRSAADLATSCVDPAFRGGIVRRVGSVVTVTGALTSALRRDVLDACSQASMLDLTRVRHSTVDGIALCLIARDRFGIQIGRCSDHVTWYMRGWTNHECEGFCAQPEALRGHCRRTAVRRNSMGSEVAA